MVTVIKGTDNPETISGTSHADNIYGYGGDDVLKGNGGSDFLFGGSGNDTLIGGVGVNDYWGDSGNDTFQMSVRGSAGGSDDLIHDFAQGADRIDVSRWGISDLEQVRKLLYVDSHGDAAFNAFFDGFDHVLRIKGISPGALTSSDFVFSHSGPVNETGTSFDDVLFGSSGNDTLDGKGGRDLLLGGHGNDTLTGGFGLDSYDGGQGFDTVSYAYSNEIVDVYLNRGVAIFGDGAREFLSSIEAVTGSSAGNWLTGSNGANTLTGLAGNDILKGLGGGDRLDGGGGADKLVGGGGDDVFVYSHLGDSTTAGSGRDTITDFAGGDKIDLTGLEAATGENFDFIGHTPFTHTAGEISFHVNNAGNTIVWLDSDGNGSADFAIQLDGSHTLSAGDFIL